MLWIVLNNLIWVIGILVYYNLQPKNTEFSALQKALDSLSNIIPQVIRETRTGIYTNLYPRDNNGTTPVGSDTTNDRPSRQILDEEEDSIFPTWESVEEYLGIKITENSDQWTSPTLPQTE